MASDDETSLGADEPSLADESDEEQDELRSEIADLEQQIASCKAAFRDFKVLAARDQRDADAAALRGRILAKRDAAAASEAAVADACSQLHTKVKLRRTVRNLEAEIEDQRPFCIPVKIVNIFSRLKIEIPIFLFSSPILHFSANF